jgi:hypothetical protein
MKIQKQLRIATLALAGMLATEGAFGFSITIHQGSFQAGNGGEFAAVTSPDSFTSLYDSKALQSVAGGVGFSTFCLEKGENLTFGTTYTGVLNDRALSGGPDVSEVPNLAGDPISRGTAYLYFLFSEGTLAGYAYGDSPYSNAEKTARTASAALLQAAIWMLEDEEAPDFANPFLALAIAEAGSLAAAKDSNLGAYPVMAINVSEGSTGRQDVLVRVPVVPDAGMTLGMLGLGLIAVGATRRMKKA